MARKPNKRYHNGGQQLPLLTPETTWRPGELPDLRRCERVALDRETKDDGLSNKVGPGWATGRGYVIGTSVAWREGGEYRSAYFPVAHPDTECHDPDAVRRWEIDHQKAGVEFVMFNAPYDVGWGAESGVPVPEKLHDAGCAAYLVDETQLDLSLDALCRWRGLPGKDERLLREAAEAYKIDPKSEMWRLPARFVAEYAGVDAVRTLQLMESLEPELDEQKLRRAYELEMGLVPMIYAMRKRGLRISVDKAEQARDKCLEISRQAFADLSDKLGQTVTIDEARKNDWLMRAFDSQRLRYPKSEFDGRGSFEKKWMERESHWLPLLLVRGKSYHEAATKFLQGFLLDFAHRGRLHANINQFKSEDGGTRTSRFSYSDPPLQQMPHRNEELSSLIRGCFLPEEGEYWLACDYSQQEYRLIVHYAAKRGLPKADAAAQKYRDDPRTDFHSMVAEMTGLARKPAKDTNFAKSYGAGVKKFAAMTNKSEAEAEKIMRQYDEEMPFVKMLNEACEKKAARTGFIRLLDGARIHFETWEPTWLSREERKRGWTSNGEIKMGDCRLAEARERVADPDHPWYGKSLRRAQCRKAMNGLIQGGAARQTKTAMLACWREGLLPLLQMHDELDFSVSDGEQGERAAKIMREVVPLLVPMQVDAEYGVDWGDANHTWDKFTERLAAGRSR